MPRVATYMSVKPGMEDRYREEHQAIWPGVVAGISRYGISNYSIFMHGRELYSYFEVEDLQKAMTLAAADPVNQAWQEHMAEFFEVGPAIGEGAPVTPVELFHTDGYQGSIAPGNRVATLMMVKPGLEEAYIAAHDDIWPEILEGIARAKITAYSIFMIGRKLFSVFQVEDLEEAMTMLSADPDNRRWQAHMAHMFDIGPGVRGGTTVYLEEVFHVD